MIIISIILLVVSCAFVVYFLYGEHLNNKLKHLQQGRFVKVNKSPYRKKLLASFNVLGLCLCATVLSVTIKPNNIIGVVKDRFDYQNMQVATESDVALLTSNPSDVINAVEYDDAVYVADASRITRLSANQVYQSKQTESADNTGLLISNGRLISISRNQENFSLTVHNIHTLLEEHIIKYSTGELITVNVTNNTTDVFLRVKGRVDIEQLRFSYDEDVIQMNYQDIYYLNGIGSKEMFVHVNVNQNKQMSVKAIMLPMFFFSLNDNYAYLNFNIENDAQGFAHSMALKYDIKKQKITSTNEFGGTTYQEISFDQKNSYLDVACSVGEKTIITKYALDNKLKVINKIQNTFEIMKSKAETFNFAKTAYCLAKVQVMGVEVAIEVNDNKIKVCYNENEKVIVNDAVAFKKITVVNSATITDVINILFKADDQLFYLSFNITDEELLVEAVEANDAYLTTNFLVVVNNDDYYVKCFNEKRTVE